MKKLPRARIRHRDGHWRVVPVHASAGYLFVNRAVWHWGYCVSHRPTGSHIPGTHRYTVQDAIRLMEALAPIIPRAVKSLPVHLREKLAADVAAIVGRMA